MIFKKLENSIKTKPKKPKLSDKIFFEFWKPILTITFFLMNSKAKLETS